MMIDAHQHCWQLSRPECVWPGPELTPIYRDFDPKAWKLEARREGVDASVLVQSQPDERDTSYLLSLADQHEWILGVVGWVDLKAVAAPDRIRALAEHPRLRGLRPMLEAIEEPDWIDDPALDRAVEAMIEARLCFDALVQVPQLPHLERFARRHPGLTVILDHAAKPPVASADRSVWPTQMARLAALPNVYCKLSGLLSESAGAHSEAQELNAEQHFERLRPWVSDLLAWFGPGRLLWGSDWPVVNLVSDYASWVELTKQLLMSLSEEEQAAIWGENAIRVYGLQSASADLEARLRA